ncbi:Protein kinase-like domain [Pseudocohnilembus persalinus]|uniref:Protein kinase-like domain n=1 Tax=Pseudocohnilembus persalinus TaxID=266149 RepID=A0A0V0QZD6_PSEPJ|nr:Protein kinase-like domain [Pseudocohnilembus persalinus]|eukprot:KRX07671.1 Protein kinase-like domain [Pseudocohnilembus persalinus]
MIILIFFFNQQINKEIIIKNLGLSNIYIFLFIFYPFQKVIDKNQINLKDPFLAESLKKEIKIMESLKSPHIVKMYDVFGTQNNIYLMLEYCNGGDLRHLLKKNNGRLQEDVAINILAQLMDGLKELVDNGYIHRDIKPENSLIHDGKYMVADFGFATKVDIRGRQLMREYVGSPLYMSPQILQQQGYSAKSDIWSIGMMFYEMLFGKHPWNCRDIHSLLKGIKNTPLRFPYDKPISANTKDFIKQCLQVDESQRIGWDQIFKHPLIQNHLSKSNNFKNSNNSKEQPQQQLDEKSKKALKKVQDIVQYYKIDIQDIFQHFDTDKGGFLDQQEFSSFLKKIDPSLTESEAINVFQKVDVSGDGQISFKEFQQLFNEYDFSELGDLASNLINELREIIISYKLNLSDIFKNFDKDKQGTLDILEFEHLLRIIAPGLKQEDVKTVFNKFDIDGDGEITFEEFRSIIDNKQSTNQNSGGSNKKSLQAQRRNSAHDKAKAILSQLKSIVVNKKLDVKKIFNNFDTSKDNQLQFEEIKKMMQVFDKRINDEEVYIVIKYLDQDGDQQISLEEFERALQQ